MADNTFFPHNEIGPTAPTKPQVAANPSAYDGTSFDPTVQNCNPTALRVFGTVEGVENMGINTFAGFFKADQNGALAWFASDGQYGVPLNLDGLTSGQKARLGIGAKATTIEALAKQQDVIQIQLAAVLSILAPTPKKK